MAVGSGVLPELLPVAGVQVGVASAGIKRPGRDDLVVFAVEAGGSIAATFTKNRFCAAPVHVSRAHLTVGSAADTRYLVINTGNANAGTGEQGMRDAQATCDALAELMGVAPEQVMPFSTGVIGEPLPLAKLVAAMPQAKADLKADGWLRAASGIMTTDTRPKAACRQFVLDGQTITLTGISKGAGMIKPNMATMLGFAATDLPCQGEVLQALLSDAVELSFNRITIDGDTSTNDACVLLASGKAAINPITQLDDPRCAVVREELRALMIELAQAIVRDGEGATKFVAVAIQGGANEAECVKAAYAIAESPLVKTALFASDPNWGRLLAALGRSGIDDLEVGGVNVWINGCLIAENGGRAASYTEAQGQQAMAPEEIEIRIALGRGEAQATVWTCDFSHEYVTINAEYRT